MAFPVQQNYSLRRWIPLGLSVLIHAGLVGGLIYGYRAYRNDTDIADLPRPVSPDALLVEGAKAGGVQNGNFMAAAQGVATHSLIPSLPSAKSNFNDSPPSLLGVNSGEAGNTAPMIGITSATAGGAVGLPTDQHIAGPPATFMGISGDAIRVVFVCDASGSMMDRLPILEAQLKYSIDQLQSIQWFNVVFFQDSNAVAVNPKSLIQALPANRQRVEDLLQNVHAHGGSNPLTAIRLAFSQHPQVVYLLTDGDFGDVADSITDQQVVDEIHRLNNAGHTCVNTILFISNAADLQDEDARGGKAVLQKIAAGNNGTFKVVVAE
ncbi:MAG TPA: VWA domain-containing protein [Tepidisphaeraceae bacterium]|jgi:hypothetical protein